MPRITLTAARVEALKPRKTTRDIRDAELRGFGVRVLLTGKKRFFVQCQHRGERIWKIVGDVGTMSPGEARASAAGMLAAIRQGGDAPHCPDETLFETVAGTVFERHARLWNHACSPDPGTASGPLPAAFSNISKSATCGSSVSRPRRDTARRNLEAAPERSGQEACGN